MTTKEDIEAAIAKNIRTGGPVWSLLEQLEEPKGERRRRSLWWVLVVLLALGAVLLTSCKAIQKHRMEQPKSR